MRICDDLVHYPLSRISSNKKRACTREGKGTFFSLFRAGKQVPQTTTRNKSHPSAETPKLLEVISGPLEERQSPLTVSNLLATLLVVQIQLSKSKKATCEDHAYKIASITHNFITTYPDSLHNFGIVSVNLWQFCLWSEGVFWLSLRKNLEYAFRCQGRGKYSDDGHEIGNIRFSGVTSDNRVDTSSSVA